MNTNIVMIAALSMAHATGPSDVPGEPDVIVPVSVVGEAALSPDVAWTLKDAQRAAHIKALETGAASLVQAHVILRNDPEVLRDVVATVNGVLLDAHWGDLVRVPGGTTATVALTANVNVSAVERAVCVVVKANHDPKLTLVVVERAGDGTRWSNEGVTHAVLHAAFTDACFTVVARVPLTEVAATGEPSPAQLKQIVYDSNAQYVIVAAAEATAEKDVPGAWRASLRMKAINTATNEVESVASSMAVVQSGAAPDALSRALTSAAGATRATNEPMASFVVNDLVAPLVRRWSGDGPSHSSRIQVIVEGSQGQTAANAIAAAMRKVFGEGAKIELRSAKGQLRYDVSVDGGADMFATLLEGKAVGKKFIEIIEVSRGKVIMKLISAQPAPLAPK